MACVFGEMRTLITGLRWWWWWCWSPNAVPFWEKQENETRWRLLRPLIIMGDLPHEAVFCQPSGSFEGLGPSDRDVKNSQASRLKTSASPLAGRHL